MIDTNSITANFDYNKIYYQKNKNNIKEKRRLYYINNKNDILEQRKTNYYNIEKLEQIQCQFCHCYYNKKYIKKHQQTKKCLDFQ